MSVKTSIQKIRVILADLEQSALILDDNNGKLKAHTLLKDTALFSIDLFNTNSDLFNDYVSEIKNKTTQLERLLSNQNDELSSYQIKVIEKQITALLNAFNSNSQIHNEAQNRLNAINTRRYKNSIKAVFKPTQNLYQSLSEHHEFERRLLVMLTDKEQLRLCSNNSSNEKISQDVLTLHQRLGRCRQAISKIEADIVKFENHN